VDCQRHPKLRHLDKYSEAEVISARAEACKGGHYESDMPGTDPATLADYIEKVRERAASNCRRWLSPRCGSHCPTAGPRKRTTRSIRTPTIPPSRKKALREISAGIGDQYNTFRRPGRRELQFHAGIGSLDIRELWM
jgi:hypothetical protein